MVTPSRHPAVLIVLAVVVCAIVSFLATPVFAASPLVVDLADVWSDEQEASLAQAAQSLGAQYAMDLVIVTTADAKGKSAREFADDFYDENGYGAGPELDGILFLIDLDNREAYVSTSGSGIRYLTDQRIESVLDAVFATDLGGGDYEAAAQAFLRATGEFLAAGIPSDQYSVPEDAPNRLTLWDGLIGLLAAGGTGLGIQGVTRQHYKGRYRKADFDFRTNSLLSLGVVADNLVNTRVTSRLRPVANANGPGGSSGRSSTHMSGGGRTHGGGGRGF